MLSRLIRQERNRPAGPPMLSSGAADDSKGTRAGVRRFWAMYASADISSYLSPSETVIVSSALPASNGSMRLSALPRVLLRVQLPSEASGPNVNPISAGMASSTRGNCSSSPAMMEMASGCWIAEPWPRASASGSKVRIAASVVMVIGRSRLRLASRRARRGAMLCDSSVYSDT